MLSELTQELTLLILTTLFLGVLGFIKTIYDLRSYKKQIKNDIKTLHDDISGKILANIVQIELIEKEFRQLGLKIKEESILYKQDSLNLLGIVSVKLKRLYAEALTKETCSLESKLYVVELYKNYKALGGNGVLEDSHRMFLDLPMGKTKRRIRSKKRG